jgi:hypothetical protein
LPSYFFISPSIGLIFVGIFLFATSILGCRGAIREKNLILSLYILCLFICIVLQLGFGVAAAAVATGNAPEVEGPILGVIGKHYREFDWRSLDMFFPEACYAGFEEFVEQVPSDYPELPPIFNNVTYSFPLCGFSGECLKDDPSIRDGPNAELLRENQNYCCDKNFKHCDTSPAKADQCIAGSSCIKSFLGRVGAP